MKAGALKGRCPACDRIVAARAGNLAWSHRISDDESWQGRRLARCPGSGEPLLDVCEHEIDPRRPPFSLDGWPEGITKKRWPWVIGLAITGDRAAMLEARDPDLQIEALNDSPQRETRIREIFQQLEQLASEEA